MEKSKYGNLKIFGLIDFILGTWMGYIILSATAFSSSRGKVGVFHHLITLIFLFVWLFLKVMFVEKAFGAAMS